MSVETPAASILIVDDTPDNLRLLARLLEEEGYDVRPASSGTRALSAVQADLPDLILLDIKMPEMSGYEVCERLKGDERTGRVPIIFISALQDTSEKTKGFALGGVDYITKPFQAEEVLARVETHLALYRLRHHLEAEVQTRTIELRQEIAERELAQQAQHKSEQQYRLLVKKVTDGIGVFQEQHLIFLNEAFASMFGATQDRLLGKSSGELFGEGYRKSSFVAKRPDSEWNKSPWELFEYAVEVKGQEQWFEGHQSPIVWEGKAALLVTIRDISERKRKERELARERLQLRRENVRLLSAMRERYRFGKIIGKSQAMQEVYELIAKASTTDVNVVIYGESGTGKDLIAQTIHEMSSRRKKTFVPVNCGSIQEGVFEREFFGHRKGAFTGALRDHPGFFDAAHQGTLFLDEVGELNLAMQVKLLRAIETKSYLPVGEQKVKQADARIVAATNRNLRAHVEQGLMRQDFFYRLNVIPITVPPLRERREDIPHLVEHFLQLYYSDFQQDMLPGDVMEALYDYDWPGNIRQLQNVLLRYLTLHKLDFGENKSSRPEKTSESRGLWKAVKSLEKRLIIEGLEKNQGHKTNTAKMLQIPLRTLRRKIQEYELE